MKETILISGSTGFLGSHLVKKFLEQNYIVIGIKREESNLKRLENELDNKSLYLYNSDSDSLEKAFSNHNIDSVIHTACCYGRKSESISEILKTNIIFGMDLFELVLKFQAKIFINTDTFYPKNINNYSLSKKLFVELLLQNHTNIKIINMQIQHLYGTDDGEIKFIPWIIKQLKSNYSEILLTSGNQKRDFVYVDDVVDAFLCIVNTSYNLPMYSVFNVGTGTLVSVKDFVTELIVQYKSLNKDCNTIPVFGAVPSSDNEPIVDNSDITLLNEIGWYPKVNYKKGINNILKNEK